MANTAVGDRQKVQHVLSLGVSFEFQMTLFREHDEFPALNDRLSERLSFVLVDYAIQAVISRPFYPRKCTIVT